MTRKAGYDLRGARIAGSLLVIGLISLLLLAAWLFAAGSVMVLDADGRVADVVLRNIAEELAVTSLPGGLYLSTPKIEGTAVARCRDGSTVNLGYVTSGLHVWKTIRADDCRPGASAILN